MSQEFVRITVDGKSVEVPSGMLLVEAAKLADVNIPVFCHHPKLEPAGVCRMCLVEVEGQRKPVTACTMPVSEGMVVHTDTETVVDLQKGVLELLLLNHPLDCPVCDKGGECPLQDQTYTYGPAMSRSLDPKSRKLKAAELGNFIVLDQERCVLCRRCTRFDDEITHENHLVIAERADGAVVTTAEGERFDSYFSGNTIELCPVGALTSELYRFRARPWDLAKVPSVCTGCSVGCNTRLDYRFEELLRVVNRENPETDGGWLCDRGRFNYKYAQAENRLQSPMVRKDGKLVPTTWREALTVITSRLHLALSEKGGSSIGVIGGGKLTNEEAYLLQKLARVGLGTNNIDHRTGRQVIASHEAYAGRMTDVDTADVVLIVDTLIADRAPVLDLRVRRAGEKGGARLVSVGTVHGEYRPDVKVVPALPGELAGELESESLRAELQGCKKIVVIWGGHDAATGHALNELMSQLATSGAAVHLLIPGEQVNSRGAEWLGLHPQLLPGGRRIDDSADRTAVEKVWGQALPAEAGLSTAEMLQAAFAGQLEALLLFGANLKQTYPDTSLVTSALSKAPFVVAVDLFLTETAEYADVVLPAAAFPAKAGAYTTLDGLMQAIEPAVQPEFETWTDGQIVSGVADFLQKPLIESDDQLDKELNQLGCIPANGILPGLASKTVRSVLDSGIRFTAEAGNELILVPVERLFAGGGTALFDEEIAHARPKAEGYIHPEDAASHGVDDGDVVSVDAGNRSIVVTLRVRKHVLQGTLQIPSGLPGLPVYDMVRNGQYPRVVLNRRVMEEVG